MKKSFYILVMFFITLSLIFTVSCNKTITYGEMKANENKIIKKIITDYNIEVLEEYPADGVFGANQYVHLSSGIYLNVVDSGTGNRAIPNVTDVLVRVSGAFHYSDTTESFSTFTNTYSPMEFRYGLARNVVDQNSSAYNLYYLFFGIGLESVMSYVGDSSVVKMIVPGYSEISSYPAGSTYQSSSGSMFIPIFFDRVRFTFY